MNEDDASAGATVQNIDDTTVTVNWRGVPRRVYVQDGPYFKVRPGADVTVLATYTNSLAAAVVSRYGSGSVGGVGPHPEADALWFKQIDLLAPAEGTLGLARDLIQTTLNAQPADRLPFPCHRWRAARRQADWIRVGSQLRPAVGDQCPRR